MSLKYVAVANVEGGGHFITEHNLIDACCIFDEKVFRTWVVELAKELSLGGEIERIIDQNVMSSVDSMRDVCQASFCFGDEFSHCIVVFIKCNRNHTTR